jgi:hypothetical protein
MMRFFLYLAKTIAGRHPDRTLADVWHYTWVSNAVNDVISANPEFLEWAVTGRLDESPIHDFMSVRSAGRLRKSTVYTDTEEVLLEIARDRGDYEKVAKWIRDPGYFPESLLYSFLGWPDAIMLHPSETDQITA